MGNVVPIEGMVNIKAALIDFFGHLGAATQAMNTVLTYYYLI